ncbi:hypothetical protein RSOLAG1IB_03182 [Rhizoctonia solani AG-1 IB]|uniref:Uncharacterized protein n=1 Tax=Thanatephorus cucumeris (strain AG1-IB / isolate 7/3/14) TaxID=1108050 RepID=A0A0B7FQQ9_THACB|nr:hypothetical protein RSOLAG1IB_03182 [Rhizoctonia solani AG-1 IB]
MGRSRSKSFVRQIIEKALQPSTRAGKHSSEYTIPHLPKTIGYEYTSQNETGSHPTSSCHAPCRNRAGRLSIQTHATDPSRSEKFNLDQFIRKNESWTPPSPREIFARRLFREAQQTSNLQPRKSSSQLSGGYLVRRSLKGEYVV